MASLLNVSSIVGVISAIFLILRHFRKRDTPPLPPGPKKLPIIGNLLDMPRDHEFLHFGEWRKQYGDIMSVSVFGQHFIIVNSAKIATDMLDKKSVIYSDRPGLPMGELMGWGETVGLLNYGARFRNHRKVFHQAIGSQAAMSRYYNVEEKEIHRFLKLLLKRPDELFRNIRRTAGSIILRITYGYETKDENDPLLDVAQTVMEQFTLAGSPGVFLVNYIPALKRVPEWLPGAGFQRTAKEWNKGLVKMVEGPLQFVKEQMAKGAAEPSVVSQLLEDAANSNLAPEEVDDIKWAAQSFFAGGSDTTIGTIYAFFKAMVLHPEVQRRAQAEIDAVIGYDRFPTMDDRHNLPYITALVSEAMRWHPVVANSAPHRVTEDDVHEGYFIPKGSIVMANIWFMLHNPETYKDPDVFDPSRYLGENGREAEPDPRPTVFGFGRRICPGRVLADTSAFLTCAMVLQVYNITPHIENGKPVMPDLGTMNGLIVHPSPFKCNIVPRSERALEMIKAF